MSGQRQCALELGAIAGLRRLHQLNRTAVCGYNFMADGKAQARALPGVAGFISHNKGVEDPVGQLRRNAHAVVG